MNIIVIKEFCHIPPLSDLAAHQEICLVAHPNFAAQYGVRYYLAARQKLQQQLPTHHISWGMACGEQPDLALEAIAAKVNRLYFLKSSPYWPDIESMCQQSGILMINQQELACQL